MPTLGDYSAYMPAINVSEGLGRVRNKKKLFVTMLKSFKGNTFMNEITASMQSGDVAAAHNHVHTLKGVAGNLALKSIFEIASPLMNELKDGVIPEGALENLQAEVDNTLKLIDQLIEQLTAENAAGQ